MRAGHSELDSESVRKHWGHGFFVDKPHPQILNNPDSYRDRMKLYTLILLN